MRIQRQGLSKHIGTYLEEQQVPINFSNSKLPKKECLEDVFCKGDFTKNKRGVTHESVWDTLYLKVEWKDALNNCKRSPFSPLLNERA